MKKPENKQTNKTTTTTTKKKKQQQPNKMSIFIALSLTMGSLGDSDGRVCP